jgi:hypothetical protein
MYQALKRQEREEPAEAAPTAAAGPAPPLGTGGASPPVGPSSYDDRNRMTELNAEEQDTPVALTPVDLSPTVPATTSSKLGQEEGQGIEKKHNTKKTKKKRKAAKVAAPADANTNLIIREGRAGTANIPSLVADPLSSHTNESSSHKKKHRKKKKKTKEENEVKKKKKKVDHHNNVDGNEEGVRACAKSASDDEAMVPSQIRASVRDEEAKPSLGIDAVAEQSMANQKRPVKPRKGNGTKVRPVSFNLVNVVCAGCLNNTCTSY